MTEKEINQFISDFQIKTGINLDVHLVGTDGNKTSSFVRRMNQLVLLEIRNQNPMYKEERVTSKQKKAIWEATLEQAEYVLNTGDTNLMAGYDPITNSAIPIEELRKRAFSPLARKILLISGLLYRGVGSPSHNGMVRY